MIGEADGLHQGATCRYRAMDLDNGRMSATMRREKPEQVRARVTVAVPGGFTMPASGADFVTKNLQAQLSKRFTRPGDLEQLAGSTTQVPHLRFPCDAVRTAVRWQLVPRQSQDLKRTDQSHSKCRRNYGHAAQRVNSARQKFSPHEFADVYCANVHMNGTVSVTDMTSLRSVRFRCDMRDDGAIDQREMLSEVPRRRQFWQNTQFLVAEAALRRFRRK